MSDRPLKEIMSKLIQPHVLGSLVIRDFRMLLGSSFVIYACNIMEMVVLGWLINDMTRSVESVTTGMFLRMAPVLPMSLVAGTLADRYNRRKILIWNQLGGLTTIGIMAFLILSGSIELWHIYAVAPIRGMFFALELPVRRALVMDLVGQDRITNALSIDAMIMMSANILGPLTGGLLIAALGVGSRYISVSSHPLTPPPQATV